MYVCVYNSEEATKAVIKGKFIALSFILKMKKGLRIKYLSFSLRANGKNPIKFEVSERKEIMNIRREIKQIEKCTTREKNQ